MSDTVSKESMRELVGIMRRRCTAIEEVANIIGESYNIKSLTDKVVDEVNFARSALDIYTKHLLSTEQTDDFDGHPNTII